MCFPFPQWRQLSIWNDSFRQLIDCLASPNTTLLNSVESWGICKGHLLEKEHKLCSKPTISQIRLSFNNLSSSNRTEFVRSMDNPSTVVRIIDANIDNNQKWQTLFVGLIICPTASGLLVECGLNFSGFLQLSLKLSFLHSIIFIEGT